jgi:predicted small metal-binding protein
MRRYLACDCGYRVAADDVHDLIVHARRHARVAHGMDLSDEQIVWLTRPVVEEQELADERRV